MFCVVGKDPSSQFPYCATHILDRTRSTTEKIKDMGRTAVYEGFGGKSTIRDKRVKNVCMIYLHGPYLKQPFALSHVLCVSYR